VVFTADMRIEQAWRVPRETVNEMAVFNKHVNGLKLSLTSVVTDRPEVEKLDLSTDAIDGPPEA
jgi:hypothetical protein